MKHAWILFLIFLMPFVSAEIVVNTYSTSNDFTIFSGDVKGCACTQINDFFTIQNTGTYTATFYVGSDDSKASFSESSFELDSGESRNIYTNIQGSCTPMKKDLTITVRNNLGAEKTFKKKINLERCQNLEMWLSGTEQNISACGTAVFNIYVKNIGTFDENYKLKSNWDTITTYSSDSFALQPRQTAQIIARAKFDCSISGQKDIVFSAEALKNHLDANIGAKVNIAPHYAYEAIINGVDDAETYVGVCNRLWSTQIPVTIKNNGIANEFTIDYRGLPGFVRAESEFVSLGEGEAKTFYLNVNTHKYRDEDKQYNIKIVITPKYGSVLIKKVKLALESCYEHKIVIEDDTRQTKPMDVCAGYPYNFDFNVYNNGRYDETMTFKIEGAPGTVSVSTDEMYIAPGTTNKGVLTITGPETNEVYNIRVAALLQNGLEEKDGVWIKSYDSQGCHAVDVKENYKVNYDNKEVLIKLKQKGIIGGEYDLELGENPVASLEESSVNLTGTAFIKLNIDSDGKEENIYDLLLTLTHKESGTEYKKNIRITLKDKSVLIKAYEYFTSNTCKQISIYQVLIAILLIILIFYFSIKGPHYPYKFWNRVSMKIPILIVLFIVFLVAAALVVVLTGIPKTNYQVYDLRTSYEDLHFEWVENDKYILDVSEFFSDPDKDALTFQVSEIRNVDTKVMGGKIGFYPENGWTGERTFTITALDAQGGEVESPEMSLRIVPRVDRTFTEWYNIYCWYGNLAIFLLILILIFLIVIVKQKVRKRR